MSRKTFLDLDRTLFDTDVFNHGHWRLIEQWYPEVDTKAEFLRQDDFRVFDAESGMNYYDFTAHLGTLGLRASEIYDRLRNSDLGDGRLQYPGVAELVEWAKQQGDVNILTYGLEDYQRLKYQLCPDLAEIKLITTLLPKDEFFREGGFEGDVWLVDDKPIGGEILPGVKFIQTVGYSGLSVEDSPWPVANSLTDVAKIIEQRSAEKGKH